jgi:hypothetical protein
MTSLIHNLNSRIRARNESLLAIPRGFFQFEPVRFMVFEPVAEYRASPTGRSGKTLSPVRLSQFPSGTTLAVRTRDAQAKELRLRRQRNGPLTPPANIYASARWSFPVLLALLAATSGCAVAPVSLGTFTTAFDSWMPSGGRKLTEDEPRFYVELRPSIGAKVRKVYPLDRDLVLQDAVELASATSRFANMNIYIYRTDETGKRAKFGADFDLAKRRVKYETDYAIHPGDTIVFEEDSSSALSDTLDRMTGSTKKTRYR